MPDHDPAPLDHAAPAATWGQAWPSIGKRAPAGLLAELMSAWSEPHLHYHDEVHAQVLQRFLDRPRLYHGEHAAALREAQARINLAAALTLTLRRLAQ